MGASSGHLLDRCLAGSDRVEPHRDAEVLGEAAGQVVTRTLGSLAAQVIGIRAVARDDPQLAVGQDPLQ